MSLTFSAKVLQAFLRESSPNALVLQEDVASVGCQGAVSAPGKSLVKCLMAYFPILLSFSIWRLFQMCPASHLLRASGMF